MWRAIMGFAGGASAGVIATQSPPSRSKKSDVSHSIPSPRGDVPDAVVNVRDFYCYGEICARETDNVAVSVNRAVLDEYAHSPESRAQFRARANGWGAWLVHLARECSELPEFSFIPSVRALQACAIRAYHVCDVWDAKLNASRE
jgi:hypothetical protein